MTIEYARLLHLVHDYPLLALLVGIVIWVFGWKIYKAFIVVAGALIGATLAYQYAVVNDQVLRLLLTIAGGAVGAFTAIFALYFMVFLFGVYSGAGIAALYLGSDAFLISLAFGLVVGILLVLLFKFTVVLMTAFSGAFLIVNSLVQILNMNMHTVSIQLAILGLTAIGVFMQYQVWGQPDVERQLAEPRPGR